MLGWLSGVVVSTYSSHFWSLDVDSSLPVWSGTVVSCLCVFSLLCVSFVHETLQTVHTTRTEHECGVLFVPCHWLANNPECTLCLCQKSAGTGSNSPTTVIRTSTIENGWNGSNEFWLLSLNSGSLSYHFMDTPLVLVPHGINPPLRLSVQLLANFTSNKLCSLPVGVHRVILFFPIPN